jgi:hypothetical protein
VRYRCTEPARAAPEARAESKRLAALPEELRTELRHAVIALNVERIAGVIGRVSERDPVLGAVLARCAERFAYTAILKAVEGCKAKSAGESA